MNIYTLNGKINKIFENSSDFVSRKLILSDGFICFVYSIKEQTDKNYIGEKIIKPLLSAKFPSFHGEFEKILQTSSFESIKKNIVSEIEKAILSGSVAVAVGNGKSVFCAVCGADSYFGLSASKSETDVTVTGPSMGFVNDIDKNISLLRKILRTSDFKTEKFTKGKVTNTKIALCYISSRASENVVSEMRRKLNSIGSETAAITDTANIESIIRSRKYSFFPCFGYTEKVDKVASLLVSGRVAVICDGSAFVLTAPYIFIESLQSPEDYLKSSYFATFSRLLRLASLLISLYLPSFLLLFASYRKELLPKSLLYVIEKEREEIPIDLGVEIILMLLVFEILREVGLRMPQPLGNAVGLVGSVIIGDSATKAGIASTTVILVVAISAVANFVVPKYMNNTVLIRLSFVLSVMLFGEAGVILLSLVILCGLSSKEEFGVPYLTVISPFSKKSNEDNLLVIPKKVLGRIERLKK